jgi:hypothetical protein
MGSLYSAIDLTLGTFATPDYRIFVPSPAIKQPTIPAFPGTTPLFEKKGHILVLAESPDILDPFSCHRARSWATFPANYSPMDTHHVNGVNWPKKRLERDKPHACWH